MPIGLSHRLEILLPRSERTQAGHRCIFGMGPRPSSPSISARAGRSCPTRRPGCRNRSRAGRRDQTRGWDRRSRTSPATGPNSPCSSAIGSREEPEFFVMTCAGQTLAHPTGGAKILGGSRLAYPTLKRSPLGRHARGLPSIFSRAWNTITRHIHLADWQLLAAFLIGKRVLMVGCCGGSYCCLVARD